MVLEQVCQLPQPFTAADLVQACEQEHISVGTVYNTLNLLQTAQILYSIKRERGTNASTEYALIQPQSVHIQVVCHKCGRKSEIKDEAITRLVKERRYTNFNMQGFSLYVFGECKRCSSKRMKQLTNKE